MEAIAWERFPIDPHAGPRSLHEVLDAEPLAPHVALAGAETRTADGAVFAEANMARFLGQQTLLVDDILSGPQAVASSLAEAAERLGAGLAFRVDVGGDVLGDGSEPGLASPLCDAVMLAAAVLLARAGTATVGGVFGPGCDGELTVPEVLDRLAALAGAGGLLGARGISPDVATSSSERCRWCQRRRARRPSVVPAARRDGQPSGAAAARSSCPRSARSPSTSTPRWRSRRWRGLRERFVGAIAGGCKQQPERARRADGAGLRTLAGEGVST